MMARQRAKLGFDTDDASLDPAEWEIGTPAPARPAEGTARKAAEATGFRSRETVAPPPAPAAIPAPVQGQGGAGAQTSDGPERTVQSESAP